MVLLRTSLNFNTSLHFTTLHPTTLIDTSLPLIYTSLPLLTGTAVAQWLRCCATNRKVAGSIPDGVIRTVHLGIIKVLFIHQLMYFNGLF